MGWLTKFRLRHAAKQYAAKLPHKLQEGWGAAEQYTVGQIRAAVHQLGLDPDFVAIGYAAFLPEIEYDILRDQLPIPLSYKEARVAFSRYLPSNPYSATWDPLGVNPYAFWGGS